MRSSAYKRARLRDARDVDARRELLAFLHRHALHDAGDAGLHRERIGGEAALLQRALELAQARLACLQLRADGGVERGEALLLDLGALAELAGGDLRAGILQLRHGVLLECALLRDRLQARGLGVRLRLGERGAAIEALAFEFEPRGREFGAGGGDFELRGIRRALDFRIRQLDDDGVRLDGLARAHQHAVDARIHAGREPARFARLQGAGAADLALERAFLHFIEVELLAGDRGRAGLEPRDGEGDTGQCDGESRHPGELPVLEFLGDARAVHQITRVGTPESARSSGSAVRTFGLAQIGRRTQIASRRPIATAMNARVSWTSAGDYVTVHGRGRLNPAVRHGPSHRRPALHACRSLRPPEAARR